MDNVPTMTPGAFVADIIDHARALLAVHDSPALQEGLEDYAASLERDTSDDAAAPYLVANLARFLSSQTDAEVAA